MLVRIKGTSSGFASPGAYDGSVDETVHCRISQPKPRIFSAVSTESLQSGQRPAVAPLYLWFRYGAPAFPFHVDIATGLIAVKTHSSSQMHGF